MSHSVVSSKIWIQQFLPLPILFDYSCDTVKQTVKWALLKLNFNKIKFSGHFHMFICWVGISCKLKDSLLVREGRLLGLRKLKKVTGSVVLPGVSNDWGCSVHDHHTRRAWLFSDAAIFSHLSFCEQPCVLIFLFVAVINILTKATEGRKCLSLSQFMQQSIIAGRSRQ